MIKYAVNVVYDKGFSGNIVVGMIFNALQFRIDFNSEENNGLYLFGKRIKEIKPENKQLTNDREEYEKSKKRLNIKKIKELGFDWISDEYSRYRAKCLNAIIKIIKHLSPRKISARFIFGFGDPYYTAKLLEVFTVLFALMGNDLQVTPLWEEERFYGEVHVNSKISTFYLIYIIIGLLLDRDFRRLWRKYHE